MVFDMTDNESRKSLRAVVDWNTQLHHHVSSKDIPIILAGNKVWLRVYNSANMYVYMYVCMHACMYVHMYVRTYVCTYVRM